MSDEGRVVPRAELLELLAREGGGALERFLGIIGPADARAFLLDAAGPVVDVVIVEGVEAAEELAGQLALFHGDGCGCAACWAEVLAGIESPVLRERVAAARASARRVS